MNSNDIRDERHWTDLYFSQRMTIKEWKQILLNKDDTLIFNGKTYKLTATKIGFGLVDVCKTIINN